MHIDNMCVMSHTTHVTCFVDHNFHEYPKHRHEYMFSLELSTGKLTLLPLLSKVFRISAARAASMCAPVGPAVGSLTHMLAFRFVNMEA